MIPSSPLARGASRPGVTGRAALGFAVVVAVVAYGLSASAFVVILQGTPATIVDTLRFQIVTALVSVAVNAGLVRRLRPRPRWALAWRAVVASYLGVGAATVVESFVWLGNATNPVSLAMTLAYATASFTLCGARFVAGLAAVACAPMLGTGYRSWRRRPELTAPPPQVGPR